MIAVATKTWHITVQHVVQSCCRSSSRSRSSRARTQWSQMCARCPKGIALPHPRQKSAISVIIHVDLYTLSQISSRLPVQTLLPACPDAPPVEKKGAPHSCLSTRWRFAYGARAAPRSSGIFRLRPANASVPRSYSHSSISTMPGATLLASLAAVARWPGVRASENVTRTTASVGRRTTTCVGEITLTSPTDCMLAFVSVEPGGGRRQSYRHQAPLRQTRAKKQKKLVT